MGTIKAVIFDMDGVLLDSETISDRTCIMAAERLGLDLPPDLLDLCRGMNSKDLRSTVIKRMGSTFPYEDFLSLSSDLFYQVEKEEGIPLKPYAKEILEYLEPKYTLALASSTKGEAVKRQLATANLIMHFKTLTTGDMVTHGKPDPEIYRMACESLSLDPSECVAIEDSPNGIKSAHNAGMSVIAVPDRIVPGKEEKSICMRVVGSLKDLESVFP